MIKYLVGIAFGGSIFGLGHQYYLTGKWFNWGQFLDQLCHEHLIVLCFIVGVSLLWGRWIRG